MRCVAVTPCKVFTPLPHTLSPVTLCIPSVQRTRENDVADDSGACLVDGCKSIEEQGVCSEELWPYSDDKTQFKVQISG